jgi:hypothetical protein
LQESGWIDEEETVSSMRGDGETEDELDESGTTYTLSMDEDSEEDPVCVNACIARVSLFLYFSFSLSKANAVADRYKTRRNKRPSNLIVKDRRRKFELRIAYCGLRISIGSGNEANRVLR